MRKWPWLALPLLLWLALCTLACKREEVVLRVDGFTVQKEEFLTELHLLTDGKELPEGQLQKFKEALVEEFIERALVLKEASKQGITVTEDEVDEVLRRLGADLLPDAESLKGRIRGLLLRGKLLEAMARKMGLPSEEELREYYRRHKAKFSLPERVKARQILVTTEGEARKILAKLKEKRQKGKPSFEELARLYSIAPEGPEGGDLGFVSREEIPEEFGVIFELEEGQLSPVVKSPYGYHIFLVEEKKKAHTLPFDEVKHEIIAEVLKKKVEEAWQRWLKMRRKEVTIWVNDGLLRKLY